MGENNGGEKKDDNPITVVLKIDMHCEGCATKIVKTVRGFGGVNAAKTDFASNKLSVIGKLDPTKLRENLAEKLKKKVELISPQPKKSDGNDGNAKKNDNNKKIDGNDNNKEKPDEKKPKELPVTTAIFKLRLHCQGCIEKIHKAITKTNGFNDMAIDKQKELVTVIGSMDMKALAESLSEKLKRPVEIVPPKKEKENDGDGGKKKGDNDGGKMEENRMTMEYVAAQPVYGLGYNHPGFGYGYPPGYYAGDHLRAPQMFSDENPNACLVM